MRREWIFLILAGVILLLFGSIGTQLYVYVNFLLGHDISVSLSVTPQDVWLLNGENSTLNVLATVTTNPFCSAQCSLFFENDANLVLNETRTVLPTRPFRTSFVLNAKKLGSGTQVYRAHLACQSTSSLLCRTEGITTTRTTLVTLHHTPNEEDQQRINELSTQFRDESLKFNDLTNVAESLIALIENASFLDLTNHSENVTRLLTKLNQTLLETRTLWETQDLSQLKKQQQELQTISAQSQEALRNWNDLIDKELQRYYAILGRLNTTLRAVDEVRTNLFVNEKLWKHTNRTLFDIGTRIITFSKTRTISEKETAIRSAEALSVALNNSVRDAIQEEISRRFQNAQDLKRLLCSANCTVQLQNATKNEIQNETNNETQSGLENETPIAIQHQMQETTLFDACAYQERAWNNVKNTSSFENASGANSTQLTFVIDGMNITLLARCVFVNTTFAHVPRPVFSEINLKAHKQEQQVALNWDIPASQCCSKGECKSCCNNCEQYYPVVFLHGHAFNKALSFEYSLDAFSKIQSRLEQDGFLKAGAVTMYTTTNHSWKELPFAVSIKASYYVDQFQEAENYVVQANSENIETYAVRLKEIIERISSLTGRQKVILITHSMGGLVARRYLQLFGSLNVKGLIMIGPPTNGLQDTFAKYCHISGNNRECDDLRTGSLFLRKLATSQVFVPTTILAGSGCDTGGMDGDGVIQLNDTLLQGSKTIIINGTCTDRYPLHTTMLDTDVHPEVYLAIKEEIQIFAKSADPEQSIAER